MSAGIITVVGAGVAGLACAVELAEHGFPVEVIERSAVLGERSCSWQAGGMLAPWCEAATTDAAVVSLGVSSIDWWLDRFSGAVRKGSLVLSPPRDAAELTRFSERTAEFDWVDEARIAELEPDLAGRFRRGLFFPREAHLDPRRALPALVERLRRFDVSIRFGIQFDAGCERDGLVVDCRGLAARDTLEDLRGVRGEMVMIRSADVSLARPVRLLHPRIPLYIVPRGDGVFMIGATMIESEARIGASVRSVMELLNAAYTLHPAFAEAEILEVKADRRPAFADNLPAVRHGAGILHANGLFRHGFLLAPALARQVSEAVGNLMLEGKDADIRQRRTA